MRYVTIWVELISYRSSWGSYEVRAGKIFKTEPKENGQRYLKLRIKIPREMVEPIVFESVS